MRYGNCLAGALVLAAGDRFRGRLVVRATGGWVPHFLYRDSRGEIWHYTVLDDFLPWPLYHLAFRGEFRGRRLHRRPEISAERAASTPDRTPRWTCKPRATPSSSDSRPASSPAPTT